MTRDAAPVPRRRRTRPARGASRAGTPIGVAALLRSIARSLRTAQKPAPGPAAVVDLAQRNLRLLDNLLQEFDHAERDETDPDRLETLFRLDHLAVRIRRTNASLLTLIGAADARARRRPAALVDVLRAAQSQVEQYRRVEFGHLDDVAIAAHAVDAIVHLLAELLDNATRYSPPDEPVLVSGRWAGEGATIQVVDRGAGLPVESLARLNRRLAGLMRVDAAGSTGTGIAVIAHLASSYGARVRLRSNAGNAIVATLRLPPNVVLHHVPLEPSTSDSLPRRSPVTGSPRSSAPGSPPTTAAPAESNGAAVEPEAVRTMLSAYQQALGRLTGLPGVERDEPVATPDDAGTDEESPR